MGAIGDAAVATSAIAAVELARAVRVAGLEDDIEHDLADILDGCVIVHVEADVVRSAAGLAAPTLRALDALHLASAVIARADLMLVYDRQLGRAARAAGLRVEAPGATR